MYVDRDLKCMIFIFLIFHNDLIHIYKLTSNNIYSITKFVSHFWSQFSI